MKYYTLTITVDTNDGDYKTEITKINEEELKDVEKFCEAFKAWTPIPYEETVDWTDKVFKRWVSSPYATGECCTDRADEEYRKYYIECLGESVFYKVTESYFPWAEYGWHTVESISVVPWVAPRELI